VTADPRALPSQSIAVLLGGPSAEHDVSLISGRAIGGALAARGHRVEAWLIDLAGGWWRLPAAGLDSSLPQSDFDAPAGLGGRGPLSAAAALAEIQASDRAVCCFPALHGPFGEDGTVQALLESAGIVYAGSHVAASAVGMDKELFKRVCVGIGIRTVPWLGLRRSEFEADRTAALGRLEAFAADLPRRQIVIKPVHLGSSVGVSIVHRPSEPPELELAVEDAFRHDDHLLAEAYVAGARELEVAVLGNDASDAETFGPGEIIPAREFYDYEAKYRDGASRSVLVPELPPGVASEARAAAREAFLSIGAEGFARVDFLLGRDATLYLSEINTIPGFTPISLFPLLCGTGGRDFGETCERIVELALESARLRPVRQLTRADLP
jgi:D-alanine-D-alanine ligase